MGWTDSWSGASASVLVPPADIWIGEVRASPKTSFCPSVVAGGGSASVLSPGSAVLTGEGSAIVEASASAVREAIVDPLASGESCSEVAVGFSGDDVADSPLACVFPPAVFDAAFCRLLVALEMVVVVVSRRNAASLANATGSTAVDAVGGHSACGHPV